MWKASTADAGAPTVVANNQAFPVSLAQDATYVYWTNTGGGGGNPGSVMRCAKAGCATPTILAAQQNFATDLAVDNVAIYWLTSGDGVLWLLAK